MQKRFKMVTVLALVLILSVPAFTADTTDKIGMSPRYSMFLTGGEWKFGPIAGGAELKFGINKNWAVGLNGFYGPTKDGMLDLSGDLPTLADAGDEGSELRIRHHIFELAGYYNFNPEEETNFYLTAGIGIDSWQVRDKSGNKVMVPDLNGNMFDFRDQQMTLMFGAGLEYFLIDEFSIGGALRYHLLTSVFSRFKDDKDVGGSDGLDNPSGVFEISVGVTGYFGACEDRDKDGVCDDVDRCLETLKGCIVDEYGCAIDSDGDGVCDGIDTCANTPKDCHVDAVGCPSDGDDDGVCDGIDKCPNTVKGAPIDSVGCPLDTDKDGVADYKDSCPNTQVGCKVDDVGCEIDSDRDGVCDGIDQCPGTPEGYGEVDRFGCPVAFRVEREVVLVGVNFEINQARLTDEAKVELDKVVESLKALPHVKLEVQGHTDSRGPIEKNRELSQQRAQAVADYFIEQGIEKSRLVAKGYGPDKPRYDNSTADGRSMNRRVELHRID